MAVGLRAMPTELCSNQIQTGVTDAAAEAFSFHFAYAGSFEEVVFISSGRLSFSISAIMPVIFSK